MTKEQGDLLVTLSEDPEYQQKIAELIQIKRGNIATLDVLQIESSLRSSINSLRSSEVSLRGNLDSFKIALGLPPEIVTTVDDSLLKQFEFIAPELFELEEDIRNYNKQMEQLNLDEPDIELMRRILAGLYGFQKQIEKEALSLLDSDVERYKVKIEKLLKELSEEEQIITKRFYERDREFYENIRREIISNGLVIKQLAAKLKNKNQSKDELKILVRNMIGIRDSIKRYIQSLQVFQINFRVELVELNKFDLSLEEAIGLALENRLDLMNAKAEVIDSYRNVEVFANRLKGMVDIVVEGDIRTRPGGSNPVDFRGSSSSFRAGLAIQAPLDQIAERNDYRTALIAYQRVKRDYMLAEDNVKADIRSSWRQLKILEVNLETARQALKFAALEYDQAVELANAPAQAGGRTNQGGVQGRNLISAIQNVLSAQNALVGIWMDYERLRLNIYRDMDIMEIDEQGIWKEPFYLKMKDSHQSRLNGYQQGPIIEPGPVTIEGDIIKVPSPENSSTTELNQQATLKQGLVHQGSLKEQKSAEGTLIHKQFTGLGKSQKRNSSRNMLPLEPVNGHNK